MLNLLLLFVSTDNYYIVGFRMYSEPAQGSGDDSTMNAMEIVCRGPGLYADVDATQTLSVEGSTENSGCVWGAYSEVCPQGEAVSAMQTRVELDQGSGDDSAVGDLRLYCSGF